MGFKLKLELANHDGYAIGAVGLVARERATTTLTREEAINKSRGALRYQFPAVSMTRGESREVEFEVTYGQDNDLKPGELLSVISAWASKIEDTSPHVWGATTSNGGPEHHIELP